MKYLFMLLFPAACIGLILFIRNRFVNKTYPQKTTQMLDSVQALSLHGFARTQHGFRGFVLSYDVNIYATTTINPVGYMQGDLFQVWVNIAPQPGQLKGLGGFFGKYLVAGEKPGFAMIGFTLQYDSHRDSTNDLIDMTKELIKRLTENGVAAYTA